MEKIKEKEEVLNFLQVDEYPYCFSFSFGTGTGYGYEDGTGSGNGPRSAGYNAYNDGSGDCYGPVPGDGYGSGSGDGSGYNDGDGYGTGSGYNDGSGSWDGFGSGTGYTSNIEYLNSQKAYKIDSIITFIDSVHGDYAKGKILCDDLTVEECYIAKCGNFFAHGETLKQAMADARGKYEKNTPIEERIARFNEQYPDRNVKVSASELFSWHHTLTGSCFMGRKQFCKEHHLDYKNGEYSVNEFISLTKEAYGGNIIKQLESSL